MHGHININLTFRFWCFFCHWVSSCNFCCTYFVLSWWMSFVLRNQQLNKRELNLVQLLLLLLLLLFLLLTTWETNSSLGSPENPRILLNWKFIMMFELNVHNDVYKRLFHVCTQSLMNIFHGIDPRQILTLPSNLRLYFPNGVFPSWNLTKPCQRCCSTLWTSNATHIPFPLIW